MKAMLLPLLGAVIALVSTGSRAAQIVEARDGTRVEAVIAIGEPTRIRIENAAITDVFGNIYSSNCAVAAAVTGTAGTTAPATPTPINPTGEIMLECDREKGEIYVRPLGTATKPINLFISSANATYTLLLRRSDTPADTIVIRDKSTRAIKSLVDAARQGPLGLSANPIRAMKALLAAMASSRLPPDVKVEDVNRTISFWNEASFTLIRTYESRGLIGEKYLLTNTSPEPMVLAEQEFDRPEGRILGVAIENMNLRPRESTAVYVIRLGD